MGNFIKIKKIIFCLAVLGILATSSIALAVDWPVSPGFGTKLTSSSKLPDLIRYFYEWGIALGGLAVFIALLIAGFQYLISVGNPAVMKEAMDRMKSAFFGLILLLGSWLILNTINPELTTFRPLVLEPPKVPFGACKTANDCKEQFGEDYICTEGFCVQELKTNVKPCDEATITTAEKEPLNLKKGDCKTFEIGTGTIFSSQGFINEKPDKTCFGYLKLYTKLICKGDFESFLVNIEDAAPNEDIRSIKLEIPKELK